MKALHLALLVLAAPLSSQWQVGVGGTPGRDGRSAAIGPTGPDILWQGSLPGIVAQQAVVDQGLAIVNRIASFTIPTGTWIVAHDLATGAENWKVQLPMNFGDSWRSRVTGFRDGRVYATRSGNTNAEYLYALDPADGSILWQSEDLIIETTTESVSYTANGDLITTGITADGTKVIHRIDATDGSTVWSLPRLCPTSGGCDIAVHNDRGYYWEPEFGPSCKISVADLTTGTKLYSVVVNAGFVQQLAPFVGPDGTVYAARSANNPVSDHLYAYEDTGAGFVEKWSVPIGYIPFANHAIGPDGSVYAYSRDYTILRLDPATGATIDESPVYTNAGGGISGRMAVDPSGKLYFTNGEFPLGKVYCYTPDLQVLWEEPITNVNVGGPAIGADGTLVVCGIGTDVRAYKSACAGYTLSYGAGCAGSGGFVPDLSASGCPSPGQTTTLHLSGANGGAPGLLVLGFAEGALPLAPGCELLVDPAGSVLLALSTGGSGPGAGFADLPLSLAAGTTTSVEIYGQAFFVDLGVAGFLSSTNGLRLRVE